MADVIDDTSQQCYTLQADGETAFAAYRRSDGIVTFTHTVVPEPLRGKGIGTALIKGALADVRQHGEKIIAECPFVADYVDRHPAEQDMLA